MALDAKMVLDDKAAFRHADLFASLSAEQEQLVGAETAAAPAGAEQLAAERGVTYVPLDGDMAMIADGAGTGMLTVDLIQDAGGRAANFCELGGHSNAQVMCQGMEVVLANPKAKALLIIAHRRHDAYGRNGRRRRPIPGAQRVASCRRRPDVWYPGRGRQGNLPGRWV